MNRYKNLSVNTFLVFIGNLGGKLISFLMLPFYTSWLSVSDYGIVDMVTLYSSIILSISSCCLTESIFVFSKNENNENRKKYFTSGVIFVTSVFIILMLIVYLIEGFYSDSRVNNVFISYTFEIYFLVVVNFYQQFFLQFARSIGKIKIYAVSGVLLTALIAVFSFIFIPDHGIFGFIYAQICSTVFTSIYTMISSRSYAYFKISSVSFERCTEMLRYSIPLIPNGIMWWLVSGINRPILEKYNGIDSVGIFSVANKFPSLLTIVFGIFIYAWQISVLEEFNKPGYHNFYNKILRVIFFVLSFLTIALNVSSEAIVSFIVDEKYYVSWQYIPILSIAVLFSSLAGFVGTNFSATRESKYYFYSSVWGAIASVVISYILIPRYGMIGASLSVVFSHVVMALSRIIYSWKIVKIDNMYIYICSLVTCIVSSYLTLALDSILAKCLISCCLCLVLFYINKDAIASLKIYYSKLKSR